jgi:Tfp pilus assembly protein PilE
MKNTNKTSGFTVVELLLTLFIAAAFLMSGYQLYSLIIKNGSNIRFQSIASNVANDYLDRYKQNITLACTPLTLLDNQPITVDKLTDVTITISITCPYASTTSISKITSVVKYGTPQQTVGNSTYSTLPTVPSTLSSYPLLYNDSSLVSYYPLDGNSINAKGTTNGSDTVISYSASNGRFNQGIGLNGTSSNISIAHNPATDFQQSDQFTIMFWLNANTTTGTIFNKQQNNTNEFTYGFVFDSNKITMTAGKQNVQSTMLRANSTTPTGVWQFVAGVFDGANMKLYINGVKQGNDTTYGITGATQALSTAYIGKTYNNTAYLSGRFDDLAIFSKALTADEISNYYNGA